MLEVRRREVIRVAQQRASGMAACRARTTIEGLARWLSDVSITGR